jgi:hypothetical protein
MVESSGKREIHPIKCWRCEWEHMYNDFLCCEKIVKIVHNIQEATIVNNFAWNIPSYYVALDDHQVDHQSNIIETKGKIAKQSISILIDLGRIHSSIPHKLVGRILLKQSKYDNPWLVQLATKTKRKINEMVKFFHQRLMESIIL